jgi:nicotinamidase-related amidase
MFEIDKSAIPILQTQKALLILDLQNEFISLDGGVPVTQPPDFVQNIINIIPEFRKSGKIIWVRSVFEASRPINSEDEECEKVVTADEVAPQLDEEAAFNKLRNRSPRNEHGDNEKSRLQPKRKSDAEKLLEADLEVESSLDETFLTIHSGELPRFVLKDSENAKLCEEAEEAKYAVQDAELVKSHYSAFKNSSLVQLLRAKFVTEIYLCGALTNISVFATAMDATQFGYAITLVEDCLGYRSKERHDEALRRLEASTGTYQRVSAENEDGAKSAHFCGTTSTEIEATKAKSCRTEEGVRNRLTHVETGSRFENHNKWYTRNL